MRVIDAHTHVLPQHAHLAAQAMDLCGIEKSITLEWHDGHGDALKAHLDVFASYGDRFCVFGNVDWTRVNERGFGEVAADQVAEGVGCGMRGLKVYKALGLAYRREDGGFWEISDPALDPIWSRAGELGIPVLLHAADPVYFWRPVDETNFWNGVLHGEYRWWSYFGKDTPEYGKLLDDRNEVIGRHPCTVFICPHVGSRADDLDGAGKDLEAFPNLYYDISARIPIMGRSAENAARSRRFVTAYQDRILFGTDAIYDDTNVPTGMQAQCLYQPGEIPLDGVDPEQGYVDSTAAFYRSHMDFLMSDQVQTDPPFRRSREGFSITGLGLPPDVCRKLLHENVTRLVWGGSTP